MRILECCRQDQSFLPHLARIQLFREEISHIEEKITRTQLFVEDVWYSKDETLRSSTFDLFFLQKSRDIFEYSGLRMRGYC
jgi:hypothetical protein